MASKRDKDKRQKCFGIPVEVCVKYERMAGVKTGEKPTKKQSEVACQLMVKALTIGVSEISLTSKDHELIAQEIAKNEANR